MMRVKVLPRSSPLAMSVRGVVPPYEGGYTIGKEDIVRLRFPGGPLSRRSFALVCWWVGPVLAT